MMIELLIGLSFFILGYALGTGHSDYKEGIKDVLKKIENKAKNLRESL